MDIEEAIYGLLASQGGITSVAGKVYPDEAPATAVLPFCVYSVENEDRVKTHSGSARLTDCRMSFMIYTEGKATSKRAAKEVKGRLLDHTGRSSGLDIRGVFLQSESCGVLPPVNAGERGIWQHSLSLRIWYVAAEVIPAQPGGLV